mgnify:CR=1 FL=1
MIIELTVAPSLREYAASSASLAVTGTNTRIGQSSAVASVDAAKAAFPQDAIASGGREEASRHGAAPVSLVVSLVHRGNRRSVTVVARDGGTWGLRGSDEDGGRGLLLVQALAVT